VTKKRFVASGLVVVAAVAAAAGGWFVFGEGNAARTSLEERASLADPKADFGNRRTEAEHERSGIPTPDPGRTQAEQTQEPHPITPMHEAMAERREVIEALRSALRERRYDQARLLLGEADALAQAATDDSAFGGAVRGYRLILECLAAHAPTGQAAATLPAALLADSKKYLEEQRLAPRRDVRRVCLEGRPFARRS
jgi:hypothetical protein